MVTSVVGQEPNIAFENTVFSFFSRLFVVFTYIIACFVGVFFIDGEM